MSELLDEVNQDADFARRYELTGRLGEGGMGLVHRGTHRLLGRPVAIKFMRPEFLTEEVPRQRFLTEARTAAGLIHPNVCVVLDFGFAGRVPFLVTELVDGTSLQNLILKAPNGMLEPSLVLAVIREMLDGLEAIHALGVVHRDLKPANVVVTADRRAKILDFGLAKPYVNQSSSSGATLPGTVVGTPAYISPEQGTASKLAPSSDLYALTVMMYEMVIGRLPFRYENAQDVIKAHVYEEPHLPDHLLTPVRDLLARGLVKRPRDRYQNAAEMRGDLERVEAAVQLSHGFARTPTAPLVEPPTDPGDPSLIPPPPVNEPGPLSGPAAGHNTLAQLAAPPGRPWPFLEIGVGAIVLVAGLWMTAPRTEPEPAPSRSASSGPRTFYAQLDVLKTQLAQNDLSGLNAGIAALDRFRAVPPDPTESADLDELVLTALEVACRTTPPVPATVSDGDYAGLLATCAPSLKAQRHIGLAITLDRARWHGLPKGNALDLLHGAAKLATAAQAFQVHEARALLDACAARPRSQAGTWAKELLAELQPKSAHRPLPSDASDRFPNTQSYIRHVKFVVSTRSH